MAIAGGTGTVGRHVVGAARRHGHEVVVLSRRTGVDVQTGEGLAQALEGVEVVIDTTNVATPTRARATAFFTAVAANLHRVGAAQQVARLVSLSIVGIDRVPLGYYRAKLAQESAVRVGALPATIVRATQFHEFAAQILGRAKVGPIGFMPSMRIQPIAARAVGEFLVETAVAPAYPDIVEIAGPETIGLVDMARRVVRCRGQRLAIVPLRLPGGGGLAVRGGALLATPATRLLGPGPDAWLEGDDLAGMGR